MFLRFLFCIFHAGRLLNKPRVFSTAPRFKNCFRRFSGFFLSSFRLVPQMQASFFEGILIFKTDRFSAIVFTAFVGPPTEAPFDVFPAFFAGYRH